MKLQEVEQKALELAEKAGHEIKVSYEKVVAFLEAEIAKLEGNTADTGTAAGSAPADQTSAK